jgi:hypothetical protein
MPNRWTWSLVWEREVEAFRQMPFTPIYSPGEGQFLAALGGQPLGTMQIVAATQHYLGRDTRDCHLLLRIARATSVRHQRIHLEALRMDRKTWISRKKYLCGMIAEGLRRDAIPPG